MENYEINKYYDDFKKRIKELKAVIKLETLKTEISSLEAKTYDSNFYNDPQKANEIITKLNFKKSRRDNLENLINLLEELEFFMEIGKEEDSLNDIVSTIKTLEFELENFEVDILLSNEYDNLDAIIDIHPGAGGTESQDWASMLFRMYRRYAERHNYNVEVIDYQDGEEAGLKSATLVIKGAKAYGYLKGEQGVHRLIRISPFDSNKRRHTSFASISITPQIEADLKIEIKPEEIRIDTYRSSGAGGQHVNTTDSAIRITHFPTGLVVTCQNERSQIQNREKALAILKSKLFALKQREQEMKLKGLGENSQISFGSQIRTYTFHPYSLVKDARTNYEVGNVAAVMDGDIDGFINAYLKSSYNVR